MARLKDTTRGKTETVNINQMNEMRRGMVMMDESMLDMNMVRTNEESEVEFPDVLGEFLGNRRGRRTGRAYRDLESTKS